MKLKRIMLFMLIIINFSAISGCKFKNEKKVFNEKKEKSVKIITVYTHAMGEQARVLQDIAGEFMKENPSIKVEFNSMYDDFENTFNLKIASKDFPDVWDTHGWAKYRYGKYLEDLSGEPWAVNIIDSIRPIVTDESGKVYCLPMDSDKVGPIYNKEILEKYNIKVPETFDELLKACEIIKKNSNGSITPIFIGAGDDWVAGNFYDYFSIPLFISPKNNYANEFKKGTFDWAKYNEVSEMLLTLKQKGYINEHPLTRKYSDLISEFSSGNIAFALVYGPYMVKEILKMNSNIKMGLMPIPAVREGDSPTFAGGERLTWGIWKDSKNKEEAKKFVDFYARPANIKRIAEVDGVLPGLKGIDVDYGVLAEDYNKYSNLRTFNYFDREYLDSGMWYVLCKNAQDILGGVITPTECSNNIKKEYEILRFERKN